MKKELAVFEGHDIRRLYDGQTETWWFSVIDIIQVLTQQPDYQTARKYWNKLKERLGKEGSQSVTDCHRLKLPAAQRTSQDQNHETVTDPGATEETEEQLIVIHFQFSITHCSS